LTNKMIGLMTYSSHMKNKLKSKTA